MKDYKSIKNALISVFHKEGLDEILEELKKNNVQILSTGGTRQYIEDKGYEVKAVESITDYPSILGGRVKTLHPKIFGGILSRRDNEEDNYQVESYDIPEIDLVIVDLYPFEETVRSGAGESSIIEKIDIGGISLIRAAAKNFKDVVIVPSKKEYPTLVKMLRDKKGSSSLEDRKSLAKAAFNISSHYDTAIFNYFLDADDTKAFKQSIPDYRSLRYGENPHQEGIFYGRLNEMFEQLHGKELSYNNLLDIDAAVHLMAEFDPSTPAFAILKHNNACGLAVRDTLSQAWKDALAGDPVSAFGGILITNKTIDKSTAEEINKIFCEVVIAPEFEKETLETLKSKKKRIILKQKPYQLPGKQFRTALNGVLEQDRDERTETKEDFETVTDKSPSDTEMEDMVFANKLVKHTKSNTIVLVKNKQLIASGTGQTSRVDALNQAIKKAENFKFDLKGAVMASDAFFPFPDCVEIADKAGITAVVQPGGSIRDKESIEYCNKNKMAMIITGIRHFKH